MLEYVCLFVVGDGVKFGEVSMGGTRVLEWLYFLAPKELLGMMRGMGEGYVLSVGMSVWVSSLVGF